MTRKSASCTSAILHKTFPFCKGAAFCLRWGLCFSYGEQACFLWHPLLKTPPPRIVLFPCRSHRRWTVSLSRLTKPGHTSEKHPVLLPRSVALGQGFFPAQRRFGHGTVHTQP